ncbi:MAG: hypothetical protein ACMX3H_14030 [Sodalis sp. (in: enterobacteria)]
MNTLTRAGRGLFLALLAVFLALPLVLVTGVSFNGKQMIPTSVGSWR